MFFGGMTGSTGGGIKHVRIYLMIKQIYREFYQLIHPRAVLVLKLDEKFSPKNYLEVFGDLFFLRYLFA